MSRIHCVPAIFFLFAAFVLLVIVSVSLPFLKGVDITRVHTNGDTQVTGDEAFTQLRLGIWSYCFTAVNGNEACSHPMHGYTLSLSDSANNTAFIPATYTRGFALHVVAAGITLIALLFSLSQHIVVTLIASLLSFLAAAAAFVAFCIDIAIHVDFRNQMGNLGFGGNTVTGPGFWLTFASVILLVLAGFTVCCGRRRDRMASATPSMPDPNAGVYGKYNHN